MTGMYVADLRALPHEASRGLDSILDRPVVRICTDSRDLQPGDVFLALRGASFDGHDFAAAAMAAGAVLCIVDRRGLRRVADRSLLEPCLVVRDTLETYGDIARTYRRRFRIPVFAVTGSNGKTGTKELVAAVLGTKIHTLQNSGNFNNQIGLPNTLLRLEPAHRAAIVEMGTNQPGDIPYLCSIAEPTHALITNIGRAHIERLLSREGIAAEKAAVFAALGSEGVAFVNADEPLLRPYVPKGRRIIRYGFSARAAVRVLRAELDEQARATVVIAAPEWVARPVTVRLKLRGRHAAYAAAAAVAAGLVFGCGIKAIVRVLEQYEGGSGRLAVRDAAGVTVLDDAYNANPDSVIAGLHTLAAMRSSGRRIAVLGDMLELGPTARHEHAAVGDVLATLDIPFVLTCGRLSRAIRDAVRSGGASFTEHFQDRDALLRALVALADEGDVVLVKGSHGMRMNEVVDGFIAARTAQEKEC